MASKVSLIPIPNASQEYQGWCIDDLGVFYICQMEHKSAFSCISVLTWLDDVEEIVSDILDQSLHHSFVKSNLTPPHSSHYYLGIFDVYTILNQSLSPPPSGLDNAIHSHPQFDGGLSGEGPVPAQLGSVSTGINPMRRGLASLKGPPSLLSQRPKQSVQGLYRD